MHTQLPLFVYGSLMDEDVRRAILDRDLPTTDCCNARLHGFVTNHFPNETFPVLVQQLGGCVEGQLLYNLAPEDYARINFYEGDEYGFAELEVERSDGSFVTAVYNQSSDELAATQPWCFNRWRREEKSVFVGMCQRYMVNYGMMTTTEADQVWRELVAEQQLAVGTIQH